MAKLYIDIKSHLKNPYYKTNVVLFTRLINILNDSPKIVTALAAIRHDEELKTWIFNIVKALSCKHSIKVFINWIINGRTEIPTCTTCGKKLNIDRIQVLGQYKKWCSTRCSHNDPDHKIAMAKALELKYGPGVTSSTKIPGVAEKIGRSLNLKTQEEKQRTVDKRRKTYIKHWRHHHKVKRNTNLS